MGWSWRKRRKEGGIGRQFSRLARTVHWGVRLLLVLIVADLFYLTLTWPNWKAIAAGPVPKSHFMLEYQSKRAHDKSLPHLRWHPVSLAVVPKTLTRAVILAEDARFYEHSGFDLIAFKEAMNYNLAEGRLALGASTISQQTVKNLFLNGAKNPLRKWHELVLTWGMERNLSKRRILELYLNVAEFGTGIYGVEAAAQAYFGTSVSALTVDQAAALAATLPSPEHNNPATHTDFFERRASKILNRLIRYPGDAADAVAREIEPLPESGAVHIPTAADSSSGAL